jgi:RimJ/RimL family protein N-acetyltransferase
LLCLIDPGNMASQRVAEKMGMSLEKRLDGIDGGHLPVIIYSRSKTARV